MEIIIALLIFLALFMLWLGYKIGKIVKETELKQQIEKIKQEVLKKSRAVIKGQVNEQLSPYFPDFPFSPSECKFMGKPIDFIVFKGLDEKNPSEIIFLEIKTGNSKLSSVEKKIKQIVEKKQISWKEYRIK